MDKKQITIRLPIALKEQLQQEADRMGISFNGLIIEYLRKGLGLK